MVTSFTVCNMVTPVRSFSFANQHPRDGIVLHGNRMLDIQSTFILSTISYRREAIYLCLRQKMLASRVTSPPLLNHDLNKESEILRHVLAFAMSSIPILHCPSLAQASSAVLYVNKSGWTPSASMPANSSRAWRQSPCWAQYTIALLKIRVGGFSRQDVTQNFQRYRRENGASCRDVMNGLRWRWEMDEYQGRRAKQPFPVLASIQSVE